MAKTKTQTPDSRRLDFVAAWGLRFNSISAPKGKQRVEFIWSLDDGNEDLVVRTAKTLEQATRFCIDAAMKKGTKGLN